MFKKFKKILHHSNLSKMKKTFVNILVLTDCYISLAHIPILLQYLQYKPFRILINIIIIIITIYSKSFEIDSICLGIAGYNLFITALNRSVPVVVAVYRYHLVYYSQTFYNIQNRRSLQAFLVFYAFGINFYLVTAEEFKIKFKGAAAANVGALIIFPSSIQRFSNCMGREEQMFFKIDNFYEEHNFGPLTSIPIWSPYRYVCRFCVCKSCKYISRQNSYSNC